MFDPPVMHHSLIKKRFSLQLIYVGQLSVTGKGIITNCYGIGLLRKEWSG